MIRTKLRKGRKRSLVWQTINLFVSMTIVFMVLCASNPIRAVAQKDEVKVDPNLLQLANEHPDFLFPVIVQKELKNKDLADIDPEAAVEEVNGKVNH